VERKAKVRIAVIDDHPLFREGLVYPLETEENFCVAVQADSVESALEQIGENPVDLVLLDLSLKDSNGLVLLKTLIAKDPSLPVLVVTMHDPAYYAQRVRQTGGRGYVMKQEEPKNIISAVNAVLSGKTWFPETKENLNKDPVESLSHKEFLIFNLVSQGLGTKEISTRLNLSVKTVETHKEHIKTKLGLAAAADLLKYAIEWYKGLDAH
jgi:DNA-binding NarL/FixJ family response regulator